MRIIFSRKGLDSGYGGIPSPVLPCGKMQSIPIPDQDGIRYCNIQLGEYGNALNILQSVTDSLKLDGIDIALNRQTQCHLDPDIEKSWFARKEGWKPLFGQAGAAGGHLLNENIKPDDIFLYFGWFRRTRKTPIGIEYTGLNDGFQAVYGYFQIGEIITLPPKDMFNNLFENKHIEDWMTYHPHLNDAFRMKKNNTLFVARETLTFNPKYPGAGYLKYSPEIVLTKDGYSRSRWKIPKDIFYDVEISYHSKESWKEGYFQSAMKGQEFVVEESSKVEDWAKNLILNNLYKADI